MTKVWGILRQYHPEALVLLANYQWDAYGTKLDFLIPERHPEVVITPSYPSLAAITVTMREKPEQKRGRGW